MRRSPRARLGYRGAPLPHPTPRMNDHEKQHAGGYGTIASDFNVDLYAPDHY